MMDVPRALLGVQIWSAQNSYGENRFIYVEQRARFLRELADLRLRIPEQPHDLQTTLSK
jgi:hypothetical protein